ncbi:MAG: type II toxin-antitoxin system VapC family toxin [Spirochaetota bacterium]
MKRGSTILLDTNVLLSVTDRARHDHAYCREVFERTADCGVHLMVIGQVLREYLVVATRPVAANGLGLRPTQAVANINQFRTLAHLLPDTREVSAELIALVTEHGLEGTRVHDANIIAAAHYHHLDAIVTANTSDYEGVSRTRLLTPKEAATTMRDL